MLCHDFLKVLVAQHIAPVMVSNLETKMKTRYVQYIQRFINVRFNKQQIEKTTIRQNFNSDRKKQMATSAFRFRLIQVKNLFIKGKRADLTTFVNNPNLNVWNNDIIKGLVNQHNITQIEAIRIVIQVNQLTITTLNEFLRSTALINILYPLNCDNLSYELKVVPQGFLQLPLFISRYLEFNGAKPFNFFPLARTNIPTSFPIDTRTLRSIVFDQLSDAETWGLMQQRRANLRKREETSMKGSKKREEEKIKKRVALNLREDVTGVDR
ncbi:hypothetical protein RCL1_008275 [Eukaryota sp. TZLM3-RCL]